MKAKERTFKKAATLLRWLDGAAERLPTRERGKLWDVLTALRGPDEQVERDTRTGRLVSLKVKAATTAAVRRHSLPKLAGGFAVVHGSAEEYRLPEHVQARAEIPGGHFRNHAVSAFSALGLRW